ncbi:MAG: hypothetical protein K2X87_05135, partial [Gemmataceae bacterium]|nr:hypothetical protein [Gemmataceae bacterium]
AVGPAPAPRPPDERRRRRPAVPVLVLLVSVLCGGGLYAALGPDRSAHPIEVADPSSPPAAAEPGRCRLSPITADPGWGR